jgi:outer membrane protein OmpA-like peptidoglycan-associated protein
MINRGYFSSDRNGTLDIYSFRTIYPQFLYCEPEKDDQYCFSFTDDAVIDIDPIALQLTWDFGDGITATGYIAYHCFPGPGTYRIRQLVTDKKTGRTVLDKGLFELTIDENSLPKISIAEPALSGKDTRLSAEINIPGSNVLSYFWEFSDNSTGRGQSVSHVFGDGETTVKLLANMKEISTGKTRQVCVEKNIRISASKKQNGQPSSNGVQLNIATGIRRYGISFQTIRSVRNELESKAVFAVQILQSLKKIQANNEIFKGIAPGYLLKEIPSGDKGYAYVIDEQTDFRNAYPSFKEALQMGFREAKIMTFIPTDTGELELWNFKRTYGTTSDLLFVSNGTVISEKGTTVLDRLVLLMKRNPDLKIHVAAFTEAGGSAYSSLQLSDKQAQNIEDYLVQNGISRTRLSSKGYGGARPIAPDFPESERLRNRRIDFISIK